jgi:hypothetical protein
MTRGDVYLSLDMVEKESGSCRSLRNELHKRGMCRLHLILGDARGNSTEAERFYAEMFPNRRISGYRLEHQLRISASVFICLFPYTINTLLSSSFTLYNSIQFFIPVFLKR